MKPWYQTDRVTIWHADVLDGLAQLADESVQCVVTSPPYWNLRDYQTDGQIGLEPTPGEYVEKMVKIFREVRRALRKDGTLWLNMGSNYWGGGRGGNPADSSFQKQATNSGSFIPPPACFSGQVVDSHGTSDRVSQDYRDDGCLLIHLCDACRGSIFAHSEHSDVRHALVSDVCEDDPILVHTESRVLCLGSSGSVHRIPNELSNLSMHDLERIQARVHAQLGVALESTTIESWRPLPGECWHCANCGTCLSVLGSSFRDGRKCGYKLANKDGRVLLPLPLADHTLGMEPSALASLYSTMSSQDYKAKDLVNIPFFLAEALRLDGWYLRSDIIWNKPNPMPESVTDRPTKAHEYIFLLSKSATYHYDADAIREPLAPKTFTTFGTRHRPQGNDALGKVKSDNWGKSLETRKPRLDRDGDIAGANKRSVWTVASQPYPEAHFATFPPKLIEPCIKAGARAGDTVLDPFMGSGTTLAVARELGCQSIGIEINEDYCQLARKRLDQRVFNFEEGHR